MVLSCCGCCPLFPCDKKKVSDSILFEDLITENRSLFISKLKKICANLGIEPSWLMLTIYIETAKTMSPKIQNKTSNATGLIQFMPATAKSLGTTVDALKAMSNVEQLDWVEKYLKPYKGKMKQFVDVYFAVFSSFWDS